MLLKKNYSHSDLTLSKSVIILGWPKPPFRRKMAALFNKSPDEFILNSVYIRPQK